MSSRGNAKIVSQNNGGPNLDIPETKYALLMILEHAASQEWLQIIDGYLFGTKKKCLN
jgi:hypothetical protein